MSDPAQLFIFDDLQPEDNAMAQSLYSRSPASVIEHREKIEEVGSGKFMSQFYVGYGHGSIGDCGTTTVFNEYVSMLVAKAIQDNQLYNGQEASTRYLDFSKQPVYDPYNHPISKSIQARWLDIYNVFKPLMIAGLKNLYPFNPADGRSESVWEKTIAVRAFDSLRSLIPIGTTTLLSWHTNLRQLREHLRHMGFHPTKEVRAIAERNYEAARAKYPNSFNGEEFDRTSERYAERNEFAERNAMVDHYLTPEQFLAEVSGCYDDILDGDVLFVGDIDPRIGNDPAMIDRPRGGRIPNRLRKYGVTNAYFLLDFGSFRDVQRHRNGYCPIPLVTADFGFYEGYTKEFERILTPSDYLALMEAIDAQLERIASLEDHGIEVSLIENQYLYPMGMACGCMVSYDGAELIYVSELRSQKPTHFTLRPVAQQMAKHIQSICPKLNLYADYDVDNFTLKRGEQDIVKKPETV